MTNSTKALEKASIGPLASTQGWVQKAQLVLENTKALQQKAGKMAADLAAMRTVLTALLCQSDAGARKGNIHALGAD